MKKVFLITLLAIIATIATAGEMFKPGFYSSQDNMHPLRLSDYSSCRKDGQFPCRYVNYSGYNCGYPLFNFYAPFSYEIALQIKNLSLNSLDFVSSIKATYLLATFFGFIGMYLLTKQYTSFSGAILSAYLYTLAPYKALDIYVRGSFAEYVALSLLPWLLLSIKKYQPKNSNRLFFIATASVSILTHNLFPVLFGPIILYFILNNKLQKNKLFYVDSAIVFGLVAFFLLPSLLERNLTTNTTMTSGYFRYINHFTTLSQLFTSRFWGYGASLWGPIDDMSFQVGHLHWVLLAIIFFISLKKKEVLKLLAIFIFYIFLTHNKSTFIWQTLPFLQYIQFPWRFLGPSIFVASFIAGLAIKNSKLLTLILVVISIFLYKDYFKAEKWDQSLNDQKKFSGEYLLDQQRSGLPDYWPIYGQSLPQKACSNQPSYNPSIINLISFSRKTNQVNIDLYSTKDNQKVIIPVVYFPGWEISTYDQQSGLIYFNVQKGRNTITKNSTLIEKVGNLISVFSLLLLAIIIPKRKWQKE